MRLGRFVKLMWRLRRRSAASSTRIPSGRSGETTRALAESHPARVPISASRVENCERFRGYDNRSPVISDSLMRYAIRDYV
jgi:hypothetical protein